MGLIILSKGIFVIVPNHHSSRDYLAHAKPLLLSSAGFSVKNSVTSLPRSTFKRALAKEEIAGKFFYTMGDTDFL